MRGVFFLWTLLLANVASLKLVPFRVWEFSQPNQHGPQTRLFGGTEAKDGEYPFMVFLLINLMKGGASSCSASLIASEWVITAAHCFCFQTTEPRDVILVAGKANFANYTTERLKLNWSQSVNERSLGVEERRAQELYIHPDFTHTTDEILHDVAFVKLQKPFTESIKPIHLSLEKIYSKKRCTILGFGMTTNGGDYYQLNVVHEKEISTTSIGCKWTKGKPLICLKADNLSGICRGDSGSPLVCEGSVWGVASYMFTNTEECGKSLEDYYMELSAESDWIRSVLRNGSGTLEVDFIRTFACVIIALWLSLGILK